jgi:autotransporter-associated beta strand protein
MKFAPAALLFDARVNARQSNRSTSKRVRKSCRRLLALLAGFSVACATADAATWIGPADGTNDWTTAARWSGGAPGTGTAIFDGTGNYTVPGISQGATITLSAMQFSGSTLPTISPGFQNWNVNVAGTFISVDATVTSNLNINANRVSAFDYTIKTGTSTILNNGTGLLSLGSSQLVTAGSTLGVASAGTATLVVDGTGNTRIGSLGTVLTGVVLQNGSGTLSLTKTGAGTLTLDTPNTFTGNTSISGGKIVLGLATALQSSPYNTTGSTGAIGLDVTGFTSPTLGGLVGSVDLATAITGYGAVTGLTLNPGNGLTPGYDGVIANGAAGMTLTKSGTGTQILSGSNTYSGTTTISAGTLQIGAGSTTGSLSASSSITNNATLAFNRTNTITQGADFASVIGGTGAVTQAGTGTLVLNGTNTYAGGTNINAGIIALGSSGALGTAGTIKFGSGGVAGILQFSASNTTNYSGRFSGAAGQAFNLDTNGQTVIVSNALVSSGGKLTKYGAGTLDVTTSASSYDGATTIEAGILKVAGLAAINTNSSIGKGSVAGSAIDLVFGGGTLLYSGASATTTNRLFAIGDANGLTATLDSSSSTAANTMSFTGTGALGLGGSGARTLTLTGTNTGNNTLTSIIGDGAGGTTSFVKNGTGTWVIGGTNGYTGTTTVNSGTLNVNGSLANNSSLHVLMAAPDDTLAGNPVLTRTVAAIPNAFAGFGSKVTAASLDPLVAPAPITGLQTKADILMSNTNADVDTLSMSWRTREVAEAAPANPNAVLSDVVSITGMDNGADLFVLQMSYTDAALSALGLIENSIALSGELRLGWKIGLNPTDWETATDGNIGADGIFAVTNYQGSWAAFLGANPGVTSNLANYLGSTGVDQGTNTVWAILDHNSEFAVIPEPSTLVVGCLALLGFAGAGLHRRRNRAQQRIN